MMQQNTIASRYAKGLMLAADNDEELDKLEPELSNLSEVYSDPKSGLKSLLENPFFSHAERLAVIKKIAEDAPLSPLCDKFVRLLMEKHRIALLPQIAEAFRVALDERHRRMRVHLVSAEALSSSMTASIKKTLAEARNQEVVITPEINPDVIGGFCLQMDGLIFDGTIKARLEALKGQLLRQGAAF